MQRIKEYIIYVIDRIKKSITAKMFIITMIVFISFLIITLTSQRMLFENAYYNQKESDIKSNVLKFKNTLTTANDESEVLSSIAKFESQYKTSVAVMNTQTNLIVYFKTNSEVVDNNNRNMFNNIVRAIQSDSELITKLVNNEQITISFTDSKGDTKYLASAVMDGSNIIMGYTSLQYVEEAVTVIGTFYKYFFIIAILLIAVLCFIYSRFITKPLRRINKVATKMSGLDFTEKCLVKSEDELGNLGNTMNFLGENLDGALTSLKEVNSELQKDIDRERKIENMRKAFIADVSHELKTPITLIKGYAEGIKDGIFVDEGMESSLEVILEETDKMGNLVKDMLELSSLESGKIELNQESFEVDELIRNVLKKLSHSIDSKEIQLETTLYSCKAVGEVFKLDQVVTNFLTNAIRHTPVGGKINIVMNQVSDGIKVEFENSGNPIEGEELKKIWDKFYKVDKSRNRKEGGTGLGLSIVKNIIELHGGTYGVMNTDIGVKFYFTLPNGVSENREI
ncbi:MAG: HAMP domain-containing sensor histidine kinase [Clostridium sp.]